MVTLRKNSKHQVEAFSLQRNIGMAADVDVYMYLVLKYYETVCDIFRDRTWNPT
jgi:hypothetical protein